MNIIHIKLADGTDIVGELHTDTDRIIELERPMSLTIGSRDGNSYYFMTPYSAISSRICFMKRYIAEESTEIYPEIHHIYTRLREGHTGVLSMDDLMESNSSTEEDDEETDQSLENLRDVIDSLGVKPKSTLH